MSQHQLKKKSSPTRRKSPVILDPTRLCKQCVIGCTVLPSRDDPTLANGVALTTLNAFDETYVKFEDIDGMGEPSYRYWKDVFLIVAWNDPNYPPLKVGDKAFALYQNKDETFTTVYYHAQIRGKPSKRNDHKMVIDFLDGTGQYTNIKMVPTTSINTTDGKLTVPTVIRTLCASGTAIHHNALQHYQRSKRNRAKTNGHKKQNIPPNTKHVKQAPPNHKNHTTRNRHSISASATPSERFTPLKKSTKSHKKQVKSESDSDSPIIIAPAPQTKDNIVNNMNIGVGLLKPNTHRRATQPTVNTRKRKYDQMNKSATNGARMVHNGNKTPLTASITQPPLKRQRSSRRKAQKLKIPPNNTNVTAVVPSKTNLYMAQQTALQRNVSNASTVSNVSNISSTPTVPANTMNKSKAKSNGSCAKTTKVTLDKKKQHKPKKQNKKRTITFKRKKKNVLHSPTPNAVPSPVPSTSNTNHAIASVLPAPPPMAIPSRVDPIKQSKVYKTLMAQKLPEPIVMDAIHQFGNDVKRAFQYCVDELRRNQSKPIVSAPQRTMNVRQKLKKMWGTYEIEMPVLSPDGFQLFDHDLYLDNFKTHVQKMRDCNSETNASTERFISGLGIHQKWTEPQEIGPITVGPYVVDMDIRDLKG